MTIAYVYALMSHLRGQEPAPEVATYTRLTLLSVRNLPDTLLRFLAVEYAAMLADREFTKQLFRSFDERFTEMAAIQVACERLRSTPVPFPYTLLLPRSHVNQGDCIGAGYQRKQRLCKVAPCKIRPKALLWRTVMTSMPPHDPLVSLWQAWLSEPGPALLDVQTDPDEAPKEPWDLKA